MVDHSMSLLVKNHSTFDQWWKLDVFSGAAHFVVVSVVLFFSCSFRVFRFFFGDFLSQHFVFVFFYLFSTLFLYFFPLFFMEYFLFFYFNIFIRYVSIQTNAFIFNFILVNLKLIAQHRHNHLDQSKQTSSQNEQVSVISKSTPDQYPIQNSSLSIWLPIDEVAAKRRRHNNK